MFTALTVATLASHLGGPGFGFGFLLLFLIPLFFFGLFVLFASIGRRRWMRAGGYGPFGHGHGGWGPGGGPWGSREPFLEDWHTKAHQHDAPPAAT